MRGHDIRVDDARETGRYSFDVPLDRPALPRGFLCERSRSESLAISSSLLGGVYAVGESMIVGDSVIVCGETVGAIELGAGVYSANAPAWSPRRAATTSNRL